MAGIDLTDRIRMLDRMAQRNAVPTNSVDEAKAEERLMEELKEDVVGPVVPESIDTPSEMPKWVADLFSTISDLSYEVQGLKNEVAKMNKHVNSIQKFIKKVK